MWLGLSVDPANEDEKAIVGRTSTVEKEQSGADGEPEIISSATEQSLISSANEQLTSDGASAQRPINADVRVAKERASQSEAALERRLALHADWLAGVEGGERARFVGDDVKGADLRKRDLRQVLFDNASLLHTDFRKADLSGAEFRGTISLDASHLGRANLSGAVLPSDYKFDLLQSVHDVSKEAGNIHKLVFVTCVFGWIFVISTTTETIILNSDSTQIPAIGMAMPIAGICTYGLLIALSMFIYWHLYVSRLWEFLANLPAVFPDGNPVHDKIFPWLVSYLPRYENANTEEQKNGLHLLTHFAVYAVLWFHVPLLFLFFWFRYLAAQDPPGTLIQILATTVCISFALWTYLRCKQILNHEAPVKISLVKGFLSLSIPACALFGISQWVWSDYKLFEAGIIRGDFHGQPISRRPDNWNGMVDQVVGAVLSEHRLDGTNFRKSFLVNADFHESMLRGCDFQHANCAGADFTGADLQGSDLRSSDMDKAEFAGANLRDCKLEHANFSQVKIDSATRFPQHVTSADFSSTDFRAAGFANAEFENCTFTASNFAGCDLDSLVFKGKLTNLSDANFENARSTKPIDFSGMNLSGAKFLATKLDHVKMENAQLQNASFKKTSLKGALLNDADCTGVKLKGDSGGAEPLDMTGSQIQRAHLKGAEFYNVDLSNADFSGSDLRGAKFKQVLFSAQTKFDRCDMHGARFDQRSIDSVVLSDEQKKGLVLLDE